MRPPGSSETFRSHDRLRRREDFDRAYRDGIRVSGRFLAVIGLENREGHARLGISASRRLGGATARNRMRRRIREAFRRCAALRPRAIDLVVSPRREAATSDPDAFARDFQRTCRILCERIGAGT